MEKTDTLVSTLKLLGLTKYQSIVYLKLIESFQLTAQDLIEQTGIPRSKVYDALVYLVENKWLKKIDGKPIIYEANHYQNIIEKYKDGIIGQISLMEDTLREMWEIRDQTPFKIQSLRSKTSIQNLIDSMISRAKNRIFFNMGFFDFQYDSFIEKLKKLHLYGIQVRLLIFDVIYEKLKSETLNDLQESFELRKSRIPTRMLLIDDRELLIALPYPIDQDNSSDRGMGIYFNDEAFVQFFETSVNLIWNSSDFFKLTEK